MAIRTSIKHFQIDKAQSRTVTVIATATVIIVFSLFASKSLLSQGSYQRRVINHKHETVEQLKNNVSAGKDLVTQYQVFAQANPNLLGGNPDGPGPLDGNNARLVLDALPNKYDFPALTSSIEKLMAGRGISIRTIGGTDDEATNTGEPSPDPQPKTIGFSVEGITTYPNSMELIKDFERSIRPFDFTTFELNGDANQIRITINANTYYQPPKGLDVGSKEIK